MLLFFDNDENSVIKYIKTYFEIFSIYYKIGIYEYIYKTDFNFFQDEDDNYILEVKNKEMCDLYDTLLKNHFPSIKINKWELYEKNN